MKMIWSFANFPTTELIIPANAGSYLHAKFVCTHWRLDSYALVL